MLVLVVSRSLPCYLFFSPWLHGLAGCQSFHGAVRGGLGRAGCQPFHGGVCGGLGQSTKSTVAGPDSFFLCLPGPPPTTRWEGKDAPMGNNKARVKDPCRPPNPYLINTHKTDTIFNLFVCPRYPVSGDTCNPFSPNPTWGLTRVIWNFPLHSSCPGFLQIISMGFFNFDFTSETPTDSSPP